MGNIISMNGDSLGVAGFNRAKMHLLSMLTAALFGGDAVKASAFMDTLEFSESHLRMEVAIQNGDPNPTKFDFKLKKNDQDMSKRKHFDGLELKDAFIAHSEMLYIDARTSAGVNSDGSGSAPDYQTYANPVHFATAYNNVAASINSLNYIYSGNEDTKWDTTTYRPKSPVLKYKRKAHEAQVLSYTAGAESSLLNIDETNTDAIAIPHLLVFNGQDENVNSITLKAGSVVSPQSGYEIVLTKMFYGMVIKNNGSDILTEIRSKLAK